MSVSGIAAGCWLPEFAVRAAGVGRSYQRGIIMDENMTDDPGTGGNDALDLLVNLRDAEFGGSTEETALALGRTPDEIEGILSGDEILDDDLEMKIRGIAQERDVAVE